MPNYVTNNIRLYGDDDAIKRLVDFVKDDDNVFSLNKIIPLPEALNIESSTMGERGMQYIEAKQRREESDALDGLDVATRAEALKLGQAYINNKHLYGHTTWYGWRIANWGTKWDTCYAQYDEETGFWFDTAWSAPIPALRALGKLFPDVEIEFAYADENASYNTGRGTIHGDEFTLDCPEGNSKEAWELYFDLCGGEDCYEYNEELGTYEYIDD